MSNFNRLDEEKATLRTLTTLGYNQVPIKRLQFLDHLKEEGVGRTSAYSSINALLDMGLIEEKKEIEKGRQVIYTRITKKGIEVVNLVIMIKQILDNENHERAQNDE